VILKNLIRAACQENPLRSRALNVDLQKPVKAHPAARVEKFDSTSCQA
jgi:hypothetical protein